MRMYRAVQKEWDQSSNVRKIILCTIPLFEEDLIVRPVPSARPVFISPAETERKIRLAAFQNLIHRIFEDLTSMEPIVVVAKAMDPVACCQLSLSCPRSGSRKS